MAGESKKSSGGQGQGHHSGGQGHHGHDHHDRRQDRKAPRQRPTSSTKRGSSDDARSHGDTDAQETEVTQSQSAVSVEDGDVTLLSGDEKVFITRDEEGWGDMNVNKGDDHPAGGTQNGQELASPPLTPPLPSKLSKDNYDIRSFNSSLNEFVGVLKDKRYQEVNDDYPVDDLLSVVSMVSATIEEYKEHSQHTQKQLEQLRNTMKTVKENIHLSVTRQAFDLRQEDAETIEEKELKAKLTQLNAKVAEAHAEVAEANKLTADTENAALQAHLAAEHAKKEAQRIREEIAFREEMEKKRKEEEKRKREEEEKRRLEEERKAEEKKRAEELAWKKKQEAAQGGVAKGAVWEQWPVYEYETKGPPGEEKELLCCVRGHPAKFDKGQATCDVVDQVDISVTYAPHEELISRILDLSSTDGKDTSEETLYIAIPHMMTRAAASSREPVVKSLVGGRWVELTSREVVFEHLKDMKFVQVETKHFTTFLVMSRFKRDYLTFTKRSAKVTSSYDQRIVLNVAKDTFKDREHLLLQVQPVDSGSVNDFRSRDANGKALLTSSPIIHMEWQTKDNFAHPVNISLPCPPNPAKARKMALLRKQKEERMKGPTKPPAIPDDKEKEKQSKLKQAQAQATQGTEGEEGPVVRRQQTKWYMGQYGQTDDDENDDLCFIGFMHGKWTHVPDVKVIQVKLDIVNLDIDFGWERFMVLRIRQGTAPELLGGLAKGINEQLARRFVTVVVKQRTEDQYEMCVHVVPTARLEKAVPQLAEEGYDDGPDPSHTVSLQEGDQVVVTFSGNVRNVDSRYSTLRMVFNSNMTTAAYFTVCEVDRYLQKNFSMYRGVLHVQRRYALPINPALKKKASEHECLIPEVKSEPLCDVMIKIPKYNVEPLPTPKRAPVILHASDSVVDQETLKTLAAELGDEWRRLANRLQVQRVRIQAILRLVQGGQGTEEQAKYEMLMTWLKRSPQAADKTTILASALRSVGRIDLADHLLSR